MAKIVLIEDNAELSRAVAIELREAGFEVVTSDRGEDGLRLIGEHQPALVLLDVMLAGKLNGFDVLETLKRNQETSQIPVVMLTNLDSEEDSARAAGAVEYLVKANIQLSEIVAKAREYARDEAVI